MNDEELAHYGILGMKWGQRQTATGRDIIKARRRLKSESTNYHKQAKKLDNLSEGSDKRAALEKKLHDRHQAYLNNPDRVIAARMTKGEKFTTVLFGGTTGLAAAASLGSIAVTSAVSRRIEYKQEHGGYKTDSSKKAKKHIGLQKLRGLTLLGANSAPGLIQMIGPRLSSSIITKAAANRNAAKLIKPSSIGAAASKLKYVKPSLRGVHKITTLK